MPEGFIPIRLRPMTRDDAAAIYSYRSLPEVNAYTYTPAYTSLEEAIAHVRKYVPKLEDPDSGFGKWMIERIDTGEVVGDVFLSKHEELQGTAEIGYMLHPDHAGKGFGTAAVRAALRIAFRDWGVHRVYARVDEENIGSVRICEKVGMRLEARFVDNDRNPMRNNAWSTELNYAILDREWEELSNDSR